MHDSIQAIVSNLHREAITAAQATQEMITILANPYSLTSLNLWDNNIGDAGAQALAHALQDST